MNRLIFSLTMFALLGAACAPMEAPQPGPTETSVPPTSTPIPTKTPLPVELTPAQLAALNALAQTLNLSADQIKLISTEAVDWPDGCLGVHRLDVMCIQVITPGFRIVLEANGRQYEYHTNDSGSGVVAAEAETAFGLAEQAAIAQLAQSLGVSPKEITVVSNTSVLWPDACLGIERSEQICAAVATPGALVVLEAAGRQYEYHANADGSVVISATLTLTWQREGGIAGFCDTLLVSWSGEAVPATCTGTAHAPSALSADELKQLNAWAAKFGAVTLTHKDDAVADAMAVSLTLNGYGTAQPSQAEQQEMVTWAQEVYTRLTK